MASAAAPRPLSARLPVAETRSAKLIAVTGYGRDEDRRRSKEAGFDLHLTKPVDPVQLKALLQENGEAKPL